MILSSTPELFIIFYPLLQDQFFSFFFLQGKVKTVLHLVLLFLVFSKHLLFPVAKIYAVYESSVQDEKSFDD